ncbi:MAG TPA: hypothetical protein VMY88_09370 [Acidimicrobiales bacterium]|nr:hypothetical protein [Acidimicrobiales bacterium]
MTALLYGDPSPVLRWRTAVELDGVGEDDAEVIAWKAEALAGDQIRSLIARLDANRGDPYAAGYVLCQLAYLGYAGPAVAEAVEAIFDHQQPDGSWQPPAGGPPTPGTKRRRGAAPPTDAFSAEPYTVLTMRTLLPLRGVAAAGFATDPRAERAFEWLLGQRLDDGSWTGSHRESYGFDFRSGNTGSGDPEYRKLVRGMGCRSTTTGAVACFALHPERNRSEAARLGVDHLLARETHDEATLGWEMSRLVGLERASGGFTFYVTHDPAFMLDLASRCGVSADDRRVRDLIAYLETLRGPYGLWQHPTHPQLSRWLSFDIECSRRRLADGDWIGNEEPATFTPYKKGRRRY